MKNILLIDFGSTYTKVTAVDAVTERLLGTACAYTTVQTDINEGLEHALQALYTRTGELAFSERYACSSAAGGLRMIASGLVPDLTAKAAKLASLGAGAKVLRDYAYQLTEDDLAEIHASKPDIFLLVGGTDGGNSACILHNARMLAALPDDFPILIAGNRSAARECERILCGKTTIICENVMPKFGVLNIAPVQSRIRELFLARIIKAKGLTRANALLSGILMPTPAAMLSAMELLANGTETEAGIGELVAVDVGGATTDVYSVADGMPQAANVVFKGLPEPFCKRTVEGDIGMRYSIHGIVDAVGEARIAALSGLPVARVTALVEALATHTDMLAGDDAALNALEYALAASAVETAVTRHAGTMEETYTMMGKAYLQSGKDLRGVRQLIVTGGSLIHTKRTKQIASFGLYDAKNPMSLKPEQARIWVDRSYILAGMGLLSGTYPDMALRIMKKELSDDGYWQQADSGR